MLVKFLIIIQLYNVFTLVATFLFEISLGLSNLVLSENFKKVLIFGKEI